MENYRWLIFALLGACFAAIVSVMTKRALDKTDFTIALVIQGAVMLFTLLALATGMRRWHKLSETPAWAVWLVAGSGVAAALSWSCGYLALQESAVAKATPIDKLSMPLGVILAMIFLREKPSALNWVGICVMLLGAGMVAYTSKS